MLHKTASPEPVAPDSKIKRFDRHSIQNFQFDGRISIQQPGMSVHLDVSWQHQPTSDEILLTGPFGQGVAEMTRDVTGAQIRTADGKIYRAANWGDLAKETIGLPLPLAELDRWVVADVAATSSDALGRPLKAKENGWQVDYLSYVSAQADALPNSIYLQSDNLEIRLKIDQWQLNPPKVTATPTQAPSSL